MLAQRVLLVLGLVLKAESETVYNETLARLLLSLSLSPAECLKNYVGDIVVEAEYASPPQVVIGRVRSLLLSSKSAGVLFLVFHATENLAQLSTSGLTSIYPDVNLTSFHSAQVLDFFAGAYETVMRTGGISRALERAWDKQCQYPLLVAGYSLAAGLASMAAYEMALEQYWDGDYLQLYTFGQPRTGDQSYATTFNDMITSSYRVIRGSDHIVNEPPNDFAGGLLSLTAVPTPWHHAEGVRYITLLGQSSPQINICKEGEDYTCVGSYMMSNYHHLTYFDRSFIADYDVTC